MGVNQSPERKDRADTLDLQQRRLVPTLPLGTLNDLARCPPDHLACPIENMSFDAAMQLPLDADYEW